MCVVSCSFCESLVRGGVLGVAVKESSECVGMSP